MLVHCRGLDGFVEPYTAREIDTIVRRYASETGSLTATHEQTLFGRYRLRIAVTSRVAGALGTRLRWLVTASSQAAAAGFLERDPEWEEESGRQAWIEQAAYVRTPHQRQGIYGAVLNAITTWSHLPLLPDTQQTEACHSFWQKRTAHEKEKSLCVAESPKIRDS